jgi:hypothetical protein
MNLGDVNLGDVDRIEARFGSAAACPYVPEYASRESG